MCDIKQRYRCVVSRGQVNGELLTIIGKDANNQVFLVAWVVVDVENKDNWTWFLELLKDDLDLGTGVDLVVISDQHKGLLEYVNVILTHVEHKKCARHIYANFNKAFSGLELKKLFWACAMICVEGNFLRNMEKIKTISPNAYEYLMSKEPKTWCRAYMSVGFACEAVENGISECFNSTVVEARKKPLITMLEEIRIYIMDMFSFMNDKCSKWKGNICLEVIKKMNLFGKNFRLWDLSGIPCVHAIIAINYIHQTPKGYINDYFSMNKFTKCYSKNISHVNRSNMWPATGYNKPLPPVGRSRTKRRKHASEKKSKFSSTSRVKPPRTVRCANCLEYVHNKKGCKNEKRIPIPMPPKKNGRPRKGDVAGSNQHAIQPPISSTVPTKHSQQARQQDCLHASSSNIGKKNEEIRVGGIVYVGSRPSEVTIPGVRRKKLHVRRPNLRKSTAKFQDDFNSQVPVVNDIPNDVAQAPIFNDVPLVNEEEIEVSVKVPESVLNEVHLVNNQVPVVNDIPNDVAQAPVVNDVPLVNEVIKEEYDIMVLKEEVTDVPIKVSLDLKESLDEFGDAIDQILGSGNPSDASNVPLVNEGGIEPKFTEGHASDVLPNKINISVEGIANLLEAGYSMAKIESMGMLKIELDGISPFEMDLNEDEPDVDEGEVDFVNDVLNDEGEGVENQDDGDVIEGEGEGVNDGNEAVDDVLNNKVADDGNKVADYGNEADDEGHLIVPKTRKRKPSETITKLKLKKAVFDKDGGETLHE
uniref:MULE transposase domain-containing protein n=1 Tax=Lactuca sativa TaxID=4236 RepID=A0A9R1UMF7_LACSA|nr:hypothetical protein LSAT_V11C800408950 [Lactuca sativa]